jgi:CheY-like chemotaxis protein
MAKILLIDDSRVLLAHISHLLTDSGHQVIATENGRTAIELLHSTPVDLVLTDLYMPPPDGFEIISEARKLGRPVPLVVMSTNVLACDVFRMARALGATATIEKPFGRTQLQAVIAAALAAPVPPVATSESQPVSHARNTSSL